jgi:hypothetical protein
LVGLILVNGSLLTAAVLLKEPAWLAPMLSIAAIVNVPILGLSAINFTIGERESRNIYIGSYIYNMIQVTKLEQNVVDAIFKAKRTEDLTGLISSYSY